MDQPVNAQPIVVHVQRAPKGEPQLWERYELPGDEATTVFMALRSIYETLDGTLAFRNYTCWKGLCRACEVTMQGKPVKGCLAVLEPGGEYRIEPREECAAQRDLFVPGRRTGQGTTVDGNAVAS